MKPLRLPSGFRGPLYGMLFGTALFQVSCAGLEQQPKPIAAQRPPVQNVVRPRRLKPDQPEVAAAEEPVRLAGQPSGAARGTKPAPAAAVSASTRSSRKTGRSQGDGSPAVVKLTSGSSGIQEPGGIQEPEDALLASEDEPEQPRSAGEADEPLEAETPITQFELGADANLQNAPLEKGDLSYPINLATALRLSDARPLIVAAAQASAWVAEAKLQWAKQIWVPSFNAGSDYIRHDGFGPDFNRGINTGARPLNQNINFMYSGVGLTQTFALTDAIFQPLVARQVLESKRHDIQTAKNDALLATAKAYFDVHQARGQYAGALDVVDRGHKLVVRLTELSEDLIPTVEVDRAKREVAAVEQNAAVMRQQWRVASANLTQVLRLDPRVVVDPAEQDHLQVTLIDPARGLDDLIPVGLTNRPELASNQALVNSVAQAIRREKGRILTPSIMLNGFQTPNELIQVGAQGMGFDRNLNLWSARDDISPQVVWQLEGLGFGNLARIKEQRGEQSKQIIELFKAQDAVAADVTRAQARLQSAAVRVKEAERSMREAIITYEGNYEGLRQTKRFENVLIQIYRPQEVVIALNDLMVAYNQYFATVADYNKAQFDMYHALGYPAIEVADLNPPGEVEPVDLGRPGYLPPVGEGPPPATR